jgi:hypothetical protein
MTKSQINRWAAITPLMLSGAALALVVAVVTTGWERGLRDEGTAAHLFQLLIAAQIPTLALFLASADRNRLRTVAKWLALDAAGIALALAPVGIFRL